MASAARPPAPGPPSASGARIAGDDYQHLLAWSGALRALQPGSDVVAFDLEAPGIGNVDDIVLRRAVRPSEYCQVKWAVDASTPVNAAYLLDSPAGSSTPLLARFLASYRRLRTDNALPELYLQTNRDLDPYDPVMVLRDGRTCLLVPKLASVGLRSAAGKERARWAAALRITENELLELLGALRFHTARGLQLECERASVLMLAAGLRYDDDALTLGVAAVRRWVIDGVRTQTLPELQQRVEALNLGLADPRAILLVQAIDRDPHPEDATEQLDWVDLYDGANAFERVVPRAPAAWTTMAAELDAAAARLRAAGYRRILVRGALRQATFFAVGAALRQVTGVELAYVQRGQLWSSDHAADRQMRLTERVDELGGNDGLAVAVAVSTDPGDAVRKCLAAKQLPAKRLLTLFPEPGPSDQAIPTASAAVATATAVREHVRRHIEELEADRVYLFLAGPGGIALLLGHRWNRVAPTRVYEHLGIGKGYVPAFAISA
jgi:SMODS-associated and fused to various effectors sensor domain